MSFILKFPISLLSYAKKGFKYVFGGFKIVEEEDAPERLVGQSLENELEKVKKESTEFRRETVKNVDSSNVDAPLLSFRYTVRTPSGTIRKGTFDAETIDAVRVYLSNEGYEVINITLRSKWDIDINIGSKAIKTSDLAFALTQLSTYIKAGIPLIEAMRILSRQTTKENLRHIYDKIVYELVLGGTFSEALEKQGAAFPKMLVNMVKTSEKTGDLAGTLDEMAEYFTEMDRSRKQMLSALIYPSVILIVAIVAVCFIIVFVVPNFVEMFEQNNAALPGITLFILAASDFLISYWVHLIVIISTILIVYMWCFKNIKAFRKFMQKIYMKMPVLGNIIIYNEVASFTRTFSSLLNHSVFITDSMEILSNITTNEIYKEIINRTLIGLSKGSKISETFKGEWAFPVVAYEMLVTGESTGQLATMMEKVADHYQSLHTNAVTTMKSLLEPIIIIFLAIAVGFIIVSVILPMFTLYNQLL